MAKLAYRSPLAGTVAPLGIVGITAPGLRIVEKPIQAMIDVRGYIDDAAFIGALHSVLGVDLPQGPSLAVKFSTDRASGIIIWGRPDGWLIITALDQGESLLSALETALQGTTHAVTDVTHRGIGFEVSGELARHVLSKGCPLDLDPVAFPLGQAVRTLLADQAIVIHLTRNEPGFDIYADQSVARILWTWFNGAAEEFTAK